MNETVVETLRRGLEIGTDQTTYDDLDDLIGTWKSDEEFDQAVAEHRRIDEESWRRW